jgi:hypothetical protein
MFWARLKLFLRYGRWYRDIVIFRVVTMTVETRFTRDLMVDVANTQPDDDDPDDDPDDGERVAA